MKKDEQFEKHSAHFGPISQEICDYVNNVILLSSRYLFTKTVVGVQFAYCTHCKERHRPIEKLEHNKQAVCIKCNSKCTVKKSGLGRKYLRDHAYIVYYQKSILDPSVMTAMGMYVKRDYTRDYENVETQYTRSCSYVFEMGNTTMYQPGYYEPDKWFKKDKIVSEYSYYTNGTPCHCSKDSIKAAIKGTPFQYSTWEQYKDGDMVKFFDLYSRYPCIEYLTKMDMRYFVTAKLYGGKTFNCINWRGKNIEQILRLNKQDLKEVKNLGDEVSPFAFRLFQLTRKENNRLTLKDIQNFTDRSGDCFEELKQLLKVSNITNITSAINYIQRQYIRKDEKKRYSSMPQVFITWKDYLHDCLQLDMDITHERILFPSNLFAAHQKSSTRVSVKVNKAANAKVSKRYKDLLKFSFEQNGFIIRPFKSVKEIVDEGSMLRICIGGTYVGKYANGQTDLFCIRRVDDLDTPYFSMEITKGKIIQTQGIGHCLPEDELEEFIKAFKAEKLDKKESKVKRGNQIMPAERQGVAV